jgi:hypothetical protein
VAAGNGASAACRSLTLSLLHGKLSAFIRLQFI